MISYGENREVENEVEEEKRSYAGVAMAEEIGNFFELGFSHWWNLLIREAQDLNSRKTRWCLV